MKSELILSTLLLTAQITPAAMANDAVKNELNKNQQETSFKTPVITIKSPLKDYESVDVYAVIKVVKEKNEMVDMNLGKVTHTVSVELFNKDGSAFKDFLIDESENGGFYAELRGATAGQKAYILWTCSSTMNCGYAAPGFLHIYEQDAKKGILYYDLQLPIISEDGQRHDRISLYFQTSERFIK